MAQEEEAEGTLGRSDLDGPPVVEEDLERQVVDVVHHEAGMRWRRRRGAHLHGVVRAGRAER